MSQTSWVNFTSCSCFQTRKKQASQTLDSASWTQFWEASKFSKTPATTATRGISRYRSLRWIRSFALGVLAAASRCVNMKLKLLLNLISTTNALFFLVHTKKIKLTNGSIVCAKLRNSVSGYLPSRRLSKGRMMNRNSRRCPTNFYSNFSRFWISARTLPSTIRKWLNISRVKKQSCSRSNVWRRKFSSRRRSVSGPKHMAKKYPTSGSLYSHSKSSKLGRKNLWRWNLKMSRKIKRSRVPHRYITSHQVADVRKRLKKDHKLRNHSQTWPMEMKCPSISHRWQTI